MAIAPNSETLARTFHETRIDAPVQTRGFTLLEVLIAFIIAALALSVLFGGALAGLTSVQAATGYEQALVRARSRLAAESLSLTPADRQGDDGGGFHWHVRVQPIETYRSKPPEGQPALPATTPAVSVTLYLVAVAISWSAGGRIRTVQLETQRLGSAAPSVR